MRLRPGVALVIIALGCGTGPDDEPISGTYALVAVEGSPLPYLASSDADCETFISRGDLTLESTGVYHLEFWGPYDCDSGQTGELGRLYSGPYSRDGSALAFEAEIQGFGTLQFSGRVGLRTAEVTVPPIPPTTGPDLTLDFEIVP